MNLFTNVRNPVSSMYIFSMYIILYILKLNAILTSYLGIHGE